MTYDNQHLLPKLPVPELKSTLEKLYISLLPFAANPIALQESIESFSKTLGAKLQSRLKLHAERETKEHGNWLDRWWFRYAYHAWREPLIVNSNWYMVSFQYPLM